MGVGKVHLEPMVAQKPAGALAGGADEVGEVDGGQLRLQRAVAELRHVEQVLDVAIQPLALLADRLGQFGAWAGGKLGGFGEAAGGADDGDERRAEVVADRGEQGGTEAFGFRGEARFG